MWWKSSVYPDIVIITYQVGSGCHSYYFFRFFLEVASTSFGTVDTRRKSNRKDIETARVHRIQAQQLNTHNHTKKSGLIFRPLFFAWKRTMVEESPPMQYISDNFQRKKCGIYKFQKVVYPLTIVLKNRLIWRESYIFVKYLINCAYFRPWLQPTTAIYR